MKNGHTTRNWAYFEGNAFVAATEVRTWRNGKWVAVTTYTSMSSLEGGDAAMWVVVTRSISTKSLLDLFLRRIWIA